MTATTRPDECTASVRTLYVAFELSQGTWRLGMTTDRGERPRHDAVKARDVAAVLEKLTRAKARWGLPAETRVVSCYEAGRDGFWWDRCLWAHGVENVVLDASSIERDRRAKVVKTDRLDTERLLELLVAWAEGRKRVRVVRVPSDADEDARQADRELATLKVVRTAMRNRIRGLLIAQGVAVKTLPKTAAALERLRRWDDSPLPPALRARLARDLADLAALAQRVAGLVRARRAAVTAGETRAAQQVAQLMRLKAVGVNGAARLVGEFFGWRQFRNGRQVGALAGLTPTPYASGRRQHEQGISKAGNARVRTMALELAHTWRRFQPSSALTQWYQTRFGTGGPRLRRIGMVALARKLLIALWRYLDTGGLPEGARLKAD